MSLLGHLGASASGTIQSMIQMDSGKFYGQTQNNLLLFFSNIDNLLEKCRVAVDNHFFSRIPCGNDALSRAVKATINRVDHEKISEILAEGNFFAINFVLGSVFPAHFENWGSLRLDLIRPEIIDRFPIENMPKSAFDNMPFDGVVNCIMFRLERGSIFRFYEGVLLKLNPMLLAAPALRFNSRFRAMLTSFHIGDTSTHKCRSNEEQASKFNYDPALIYQPPMSELISVVLDYPKDILLSRSAIQNNEHKNLYVFFVEYFYNLQTFLHRFVTGEVVDRTLIEIICFKVREIRNLLSLRMEAFPIEEQFIKLIQSIFGMCFSVDLMSQAGRIIFGGFFNDSSELTFVGPKSRFGLTSGEGRSVEEINPDVLWTDIFMTVKNEKTENESQHFLKLVQVAFSDFNLNKFLNPLTENRNIFTSLARFFQRNLPTVKKFHSAFSDGNVLSTIFKRDMFKMIEESNYYLDQVIRNGKDFSDSVKFSTVFAGAFVTNAVSDQVTVTPFRKLGASIGINTDAKIKNEKKRSFEPSTSSRPNFAVPSTQFILYSVPELGMSLDTDPRNADEKEYSYIKYLLGIVPVERCDPEITVQVNFIETMMRLFNDVSRTPWIKPNINIINSSVSGDGILAESLASFGILLSLPRFKTLEYIESLDGFIPVPLLEMDQMYFFGIWMAMCLRYDVALSWSFAPVYRNFLFKPLNEPITEAIMDELINQMYGKLFENIQYRFDSEDADLCSVLPKQFKSNHMFHFPTGDGPTLKFPFSFENLFLELVQTIPSYLNSLNSSLGRDFYIESLKQAVKRHLLEGRLMFIRGFSKFIKPEIRPYLVTKYIDGFVSGRSTTPQDLCQAIIFSGRGSEVTVINDLPGGDGQPMEPLTMMHKFIMLMSPAQMKSLIWFVTGSSLTQFNTIDSRSINFSLKPASPTDLYSTAGICFFNLTVNVHDESAQKTFDKLVEAVTSAAGFVKRE